MARGKNVRYAGRYEPISVTWVNALREYLVRELADVDLEQIACSFSAEFTDPPARLLRDDGRATIGYSFRIGNGRLEVFDGGDDTAAARAVCDYGSVCGHYHLTSEQERPWAAETYPTLIAEGKVKRFGDVSTLDNLNKVIDIRNDFYAVHSRPA